MMDASNICSTSNLNSVNERPVVVRVKRKASLSPVEAFWLEINERPSKRLLLDLGKLSLSGSCEKEELKNKKVFVQHIETVSSSDATMDILQSFVQPNSATSSKLRTKVEERKRLFKDGNKKDQLLSRSKQRHEFLAKNARFEQIQKRRQGKDTMDKGLHEVCHLYDVVRLDNDEDHSNKKEEPKDTSLEESMILANYLPLLREFLPSVAEDIHSDMQSYFTQQGSAEDYVYDLYTVQDEMKASSEDPFNAYPLVQVNEEDDFYEGPTQSEYESDDSNAEDNPLNEYPDEETSEDEDEDEDEEEDDDEDDDDDEDGSKTSCDKSEEEENISSDYQSDEPQDKRYDVEDEDLVYDEEVSIDDDYDSDYTRVETELLA